MAGSLNREGKRYADRSKSSIISHLLNDESDNYRRQLELKGIKPKNHHRQNLKHIENIQKLAQKDKENKRKQANIRPKKAAKYLKIDSKLKGTLHMSPSISQPSEHSKTNFILRNIQSQSSLTASSKNKDRINAQRKPAIPKRSDFNICKHKNIESKDFVSLNRQKMAEIQTKKVKNGKALFVHKKDYGRVPEYIIQRKLERVELEQKKMEEFEAAKIPNGMRLMADSERIETLELLEQNKVNIIESLKHLPLVIETPSMIRYQTGLNKQLKEIEKTVCIFQKPIVYVALD